MSVIIHNPYSNESVPWLKGNLHAHTSNSDGTRTPQTVVDEYAARGYDFLMISDHDTITGLAPLDRHGMILIPGSEVTADGPHVLHVGAQRAVDPNPDRQKVIDAIFADGGMAVLSHPNWEKEFAHCPQDLLETWRGYTGIEIYNGVIRSHEGSPLAVDRWDRLLGIGRKVWGFANDDCHHAGQSGIAWNMVQCADRSANSIVDALRRGAFYASTGVVIESIRVCGHTISVHTQNAQRIVVNSDFARRQAAGDGTSFTYTVPDTIKELYVRFECWGPSEAMAWTQPFFLERE